MEKPPKFVVDSASSLGVVAIAVALPFTSVGQYFEFVVPPLSYFIILGLMVMAYLVLVEMAKRWFYRRFRH